MHSCPRCDHPVVEILAFSPIPGVWEVYQCGQCHYAWRSTEPARRTTAEHYPPQFRLTLQDLESAALTPAIPPLRGTGRR